MDLSLQLENTHVLVTGGSGFIGSAVVAAFLSAGARVTSLDLRRPQSSISNPNFQFLECDISNEDRLSECFQAAGPVSCCVALASKDLSVLEHHQSLADMSLSQWRETHRVNVEGTFLTARTWLRQLRSATDASKNRDLKNVNLIIIGSESGYFGVRGNADYAAGKSAVQFGLVQSLVKDVTMIWPGARVNAVAPGAVDTPQFKKECAEDPNQLWVDAQATTALKQPVPTESVAKAVLFLASESWSGHVTGQVLKVDSGKTGALMWRKEEC